MKASNCVGTMLVMATIPVALATDIPGEIADPCSFYGFCGPAQQAASGVFSFSTGSGALTLADTSTPGTSSTPWLLAADLAGPLVVFADGSISGGPLTAPIVLNPLGTLHATGRFFELTITNTSSLRYTGVRLDLELTPGEPSSQIDSLSFADGAGTDNLLSAFFSPTFQSVSRVPVTHTIVCSPLEPDICVGEFKPDAITFGNGILEPGAKATLLFAITNGDHAGVPPDFYLTITPATVPEPSTALLVAVGLAGVLFRYRGRRRLTLQRWSNKVRHFVSAHIPKVKLTS